MRITFFIFLTMLLTFAACAGASGDQLVITEADAGTRVEVQQGQIFQVSLAGNQTTGYNWMVTSIDPAIIQVEGDPVYEPDSNLIGSPGKISYTFKALTPGEVNLHLDYQRPWAETVPAEKTFDVTIVVK